MLTIDPSTISYSTTQPDARKGMIISNERVVAHFAINERRAGEAAFDFGADRVDRRLRTVDTREASLFRRGADGLFTLHDFSNAARIELTSVGCALDRDELFDGILVDTKDSPPGPS